MSYKMFALDTAVTAGILTGLLRGGPSFDVLTRVFAEGALATSASLAVLEGLGALRDGLLKAVRNT